jgi:stage II sporulation protein D
VVCSGSSLRLIFAILLCAIGSISFAAGDAAGDVSVRLRPLKGEISVAGLDLKVGPASPGTGLPLIESKGFDRLRFRFKRGPRGHAWTVSSSVDDRVLGSVAGTKVAIYGASLRVDLRPAPNHVELVAKISRNRSSLNLVGFLSIEDYLEGVVASEVPGEWPMEALKAQAVAARSFAVAKIKQRSSSNPDWLLESSVSDQVFDFERAHSRATDAVRATRGKVLMSAAGSVVAANYHSDCGGQTDEARTIWGGGVKTGTAVDAACSSKRSPWRFVRTLTELGVALAAGGLIPNGFELAALSVAERSKGGRALSLRAKSNSGASRFISGEKLRATLGYGELKSTLFEVRPVTIGDSAQLEFTGRGFGHGTGLCQWGARELAQNGKSYREILEHYYPLLKLSL